MVREVCATVVSPEDLAILLYELLRFAESQCQKETDLASLSWLGCSPYYLACDLAGLTNWSLCRSPDSEFLRGYPCTKVRFKLFALFCFASETWSRLRIRVGCGLSVYIKVAEPLLQLMCWEPVWKPGRYVAGRWT